MIILTNNKNSGISQIIKIPDRIIADIDKNKNYFKKHLRIKIFIS